MVKGFVVKCAPRVERMVCCCCSCSLRTAAIVLGFLSLIGDVLQAISQSIRLMYAEDYVQGIDNRTAVQIRQIMIGSVAGSIIGAILSALLIYGALKKKPIFMVPYILLGLIAIIIGVVAVIAIGIMMIIYVGAIGILIFVVGFLLLALITYFWVVEYSYYRELVEGVDIRSEAPLSNVASHDPPPYEYQKFAQPPAAPEIA